MKQPTVSVIMATYNHANFVEQAIESVLSQTGVDLEFLIADDGSVDRTREVVASVHDNRIQFFPNEINRGACVVTNELIGKASGEFIALINSDDYWMGTDKLAYQTQFLLDNPNFGACFGQAQFVDKDGNKIEQASLSFGKVFQQKNRTQGEWLRFFFDVGNCICHPTMLIRRACYQELGIYSNRLRQLPDFDMWTRLVKRYPIHISDRELINFRILPGENASGQSAMNTIRTINEHYLIADTFFDNVGSELLINGFSDVLLSKNFQSDEHLEVEKTLLYFNGNRWLGKPYQLIGLMKLSRLLNSPAHYTILADTYGIDDRWFQAKMSEIDVLHPKMTAAIGQQKRRLYHAWKRFTRKFYRS